MKIPSISVIISTYNRPRSLVRLLDGLNHQLRFDLNLLDVCAVDDGSDIDLSGLFPLYDFRFTYIYRQRHPEGLPRVYGSRNIAASKTSGDLIVQLDDDLSFHERTLSELQNYATLVNHYNWIWIPRLSDTKDRVSGRESFRRGPDGFWRDGVAYWQDCDYGGATSAGMTMPRSLWNKVGGYKEEYDGAMGYADQDLALRACRAGAQLRLMPIFMHIDDQESGGSWRDKMLLAGKNNQLLWEENLGRY